MIGVAGRGEMHIDLGARRSPGLDRRAGVVLRQLLEAVIDILRHQAAFLDPTLLAAIGADADKSPLVLQHFDAIAVVHRAHPVVHSSHAIAQAGLRRGDVHVLVMRHVLALACGAEGKQ